MCHKPLEVLIVLIEKLKMEDYVQTYTFCSGQEFNSVTARQFEEECDNLIRFIEQPSKSEREEEE